MEKDSNTIDVDVDVDINESTQTENNENLIKNTSTNNNINNTNTNININKNTKQSTISSNTTQNINQLNKTRNPSSSYFIWLIYIPIIGLFTYLIRQASDTFHIISMIIVLFFIIYTIHTNFFKPYNTVEDDVNGDNLIEG